MNTELYTQYFLLCRNIVISCILPLDTELAVPGQVEHHHHLTTHRYLVCPTAILSQFPQGAIQQFWRDPLHQVLPWHHPSCDEFLKVNLFLIF